MTFCMMDLVTFTSIPASLKPGLLSYTGYKEPAYGYNPNQNHRHYLSNALYLLCPSSPD